MVLELQTQCVTALWCWLPEWRRWCWWSLWRQPWRRGAAPPPVAAVVVDLGSYPEGYAAGWNVTRWPPSQERHPAPGSDHGGGLWPLSPTCYWQAAGKRRRRRHEEKREDVLGEGAAEGRLQHQWWSAAWWAAETPAAALAANPGLLKDLQHLQGKPRHPPSSFSFDSPHLQQFSSTDMIM